METEELSMKLLIDTKTKRVLFAEAEKKVIDFLFSFLVLPVGSIIELVNKKNMVGCMGNLYESIENINDSYVQPNLDKNFLLKPKSRLSTGNIALLPPSVMETATTPKTVVRYYRCSSSYSHNHITTSYGAVCPSCRSAMATEMSYIPGKSEASKNECGYVKEIITYMVSDDLVVMPMSTISTITLLKKFNVENFGSLEEKIVKFGMEEGLELLKACLQSKRALTEVFLAK